MLCGVSPTAPGFSYADDKGVRQGKIWEDDAYLKREFPKLDYFVDCAVIPGSDRLRLQQHRGDPGMDAQQSEEAEGALWGFMSWYYAARSMPERGGVCAPCGSSLSVRGGSLHTHVEYITLTWLHRRLQCQRA